jgi:hypothetical protein
MTHNIKGSLDPKDLFDFFDDEEDGRAPNPYNDCAMQLEGLEVGDVVRVGRVIWSVWRKRGVEVYLTKHATKGKKLYQLKLASAPPCVFEVHEINPGSGDIIPRLSPLASGPLRRNTP